jgi:simple sugar transport system ATP-binding protein
VSLRGIVKRYPGVTAVDGVDLDVAPGSVHALAGENGAGKTTLMRILYGMTRPDAGEMRVDGEPFAPRGAREALARGVGMVHQHFMLVPTLTVRENAVLGDEPCRAGGLLDRAAARRRVEETAARFGLDLDPDARAERLSVGEKQRLEILKVLLRGARVLILDEPTAVLVPSEARTLLRTVRGLAREGATVLFITHRLREVMEHADAVTVLRRGAVEWTGPASGTTEAELARRMVGREPAARDPAPRRGPGRVVLSLRDASEIPVPGAEPRLRGATLDVRAGEIVGVAGVEGNGQRELAELVAGLRPHRGEVVLAGSRAGRGAPGERRRLGLAHVPEDRLGAGLIADFTVAENLILGRHREARFRRRGALDRAAVRAHARERIHAFDVRPPDPDAAAASLSGGNQQKVVIAREAEGSPGLLLAAHPTRGVDVGAREAIHSALLELREAGSGVLLLSADLPEILHLSDRIVVLYGGRVTATFARGEADEETLGLHMIGGAA